MGRTKSKNKHLPAKMHLKSGRYYYVYSNPVGKVVWESLGRDFGKALMLWAEREGSSPKQARTVQNALAHYIETEKHRLAEETIKGYTRSMGNLIAVFGAMELEDVTPNMVFEYVRRVGNVQANRDKALLSATFVAARAWGWIGKNESNPAEGIRRNPEKARRRYITDAELAQLVSKLPRKIALIVEFAYITALSLGDILRLKLTDAKPNGIAYSRHKTDGSPTVIVWSDTLRALWREAAGDRIGAQPLFKSSRSKTGHYTVSGFESIWQKAKKETGVPDVRFHDLRRKAGSDVSEEHAQELLDHADPKTTRRHYRAKPKLAKPVK